MALHKHQVQAGTPIFKTTLTDRAFYATALIIYFIVNRKRKRAKDSGLESMDECTEKKSAKPPDNLEVNVDHEVLNSSKIKQNGGSHRAGYDAFMTGYGFATFIVHSALTNSSTDTCKSEAVSRFLGVPTSPEFTDLNIMNRIYLVCKDIPFMIRKSAFSRNSVAHSEKYTLIKS